MYFYPTWINTLPELGVLVTFPFEVAVLPVSLVDNRMVVNEENLVVNWESLVVNEENLVVNEESLVVLNVVSLLLLTTEAVSVWSVLFIMPWDIVWACEDVAVEWMLVWEDVLFVGCVVFKAEVTLFVELVLKVEWVDIDSVLDEWCISVVDPVKEKVRALSWAENSVAEVHHATVIAE